MRGPLYVVGARRRPAARRAACRAVFSAEPEDTKLPIAAVYRPLGAQRPGYPVLAGCKLTTFERYNDARLTVPVVARAALRPSGVHRPVAGCPYRGHRRRNPRALYLSCAHSRGEEPDALRSLHATYQRAFLVTLPRCHVRFRRHSRARQPGPEPRPLT